MGTGPARLTPLLCALRWPTRPAFLRCGGRVTRLIDVPYAQRPAILPDSLLRRFLGEHVSLSGQPVRVYELRRPRGRRRHDGRLRKVRR